MSWRRDRERLKHMRFEAATRGLQGQRVNHGVTADPSFDENMYILIHKNTYT